jgi:hypothetical protein
MKFKSTYNNERAILYVKGQGKDKFKVYPTTGQRPRGGVMYNSTLSLTSALDGVGGQHHTPAALPPEREAQYPLCRRLWGPEGRSGRVRNISPPTGIRFPERTAVLTTYPGPHFYVTIYF